MKYQSAKFKTNCRSAKMIWGTLSPLARQGLRELTSKYNLSIANGELQQLDGRWYITHAGLLSLARRSRCSGIQVQVLAKLSDPLSARWFFKATVYKETDSRGFVGYGDADPSNVSSVVHGAEMRVAETRAVNRALRKAYGIGLCSVEELGWTPKPSGREPENATRPPAASNYNYHPNGAQNGQPRLRDRLCLLIRQHHLDANLVKAYAADYCGTATLRNAGRDLVEAFIDHLAEFASKDLQGLQARLSSFAQQEAAK